MNRLPWVTLILLALCLGFAGVTLADNAAATNWGFIPGYNFSTKETLMRLFTSMFVHVAYLHLLGNMVFLAAVGPAVEQATGWWRFLIVYFVGGICGVLLHAIIVRAAMPNDATLPLIGASAPTASLIGYFWLRYSRQKVPILPKVKVAAYWLVFVWLILQVAGGIMATQQFGSPVAYWAHIGGFLTGFILAFLFRAGHQARDDAWSKTLKDAESRGPEAQIAVAKQFLTKKPNDLQAMKLCAEGFVQTQRTSDAIEIWKKMVAVDLAWQGAYALNKINEAGALKDFPVGKRLRLAQGLIKSDHHISELLLQSILEDTNSNEAADALGMLIDLVAKSDPNTAKLFAKRLGEDFPFSAQLETARKRHVELF